MKKEYTIRYENETYTDSFYTSQIIRIDDLIKHLQEIKKEKGNLIVLTRSFDDYGPLDNTSPILKTYDSTKYKIKEIKTNFNTTDNDTEDIVDNYTIYDKYQQNLIKKLVKEKLNA